MDKSSGVLVYQALQTDTVLSEAAGGARFTERMFTAPSLGVLLEVLLRSTGRPMTYHIYEVGAEHMGFDSVVVFHRGMDGNLEMTLSRDPGHEVLE